MQRWWLAREQRSISRTINWTDRVARATFSQIFLASTNESREDNSGLATDWSLELELESADLSSSTSERRDRRSSTARMKSW